MEKTVNLGKKSEWEPVLEVYTLEQTLGAGSYGIVVEATHNTTKEKVAIKIIRDIFSDGVHAAKRILREISILNSVQSELIVELKDIIIKESEIKSMNFNTVFLVFEKGECDLKSYIKNNRQTSEKDSLKMLYQMACGLNYLHNLNIIHRDLKPANILLFNNNFCKICDMGLSRYLANTENEKEKVEMREQTEEEKAAEEKLAARKAKFAKKKPASTVPQTNHVVTRWYRPPEVILVSNYTVKVDVWSLGCIFAELLALEPPKEVNFVAKKVLFQGKACFPLSPPKKELSKGEGKIVIKDSDQLFKIIEVLGTPCEDDLSFITDENAVKYLLSFRQQEGKSFKEVFPNISDESLNLLDKMLKFNPLKRCTMSEILEDPLFDELRNKDWEAKPKLVNQYEWEEEELVEEDIRKLFVEEYNRIKNR